MAPTGLWIISPSILPLYRIQTQTPVIWACQHFHGHLWVTRLRITLETKEPVSSSSWSNLLNMDNLSFQLETFFKTACQTFFLVVPLFHLPPPSLAWSLLFVKKCCFVLRHRCTCAKSETTFWRSLVTGLGLHRATGSQESLFWNWNHLLPQFFMFIHPFPIRAP